MCIEVVVCFILKLALQNFVSNLVKWQLNCKRISKINPFNTLNKTFAIARKQDSYLTINHLNSGI